MTAFAGFVCLILSQFRRIRDRWTGDEEPDGVLFAAGLLLLVGALAAASKPHSGKRQYAVRSVRKHRRPNFRRSPHPKRVTKQRRLH